LENKIKVYVGCALTHASDNFKKEIEIFKNYLRTMKGVEVLDFFGLGENTPVGVYEHDIHNCVKEADLFIAECSYPSTGLGWEIGTAVEKYQKHVLAVARDDAKITRLVTGAECAKNPNFSFITYSSLPELLSNVIEKIKYVQSLQ
jgi:hypothetical protein